MNRWLALSVLLAVILGCATSPSSTTTTTTASDPVPVTTTVTTTMTTTTSSIEDVYASQRNAMVDQQIEERGISDPLVLGAMRTVPRHEFVPIDYLRMAYDDHPLPIGHGQTISQPFMVAWMSELLEVGPGAKVLEIGTGSGYQAAVLAEMGVEVYTVEIIPELVKTSAALLAKLGYAEVNTLEADGYFGWEEHAPYDAIIVTAAPDHVPRPLLYQLSDGGRLVIPVGPVGSFQTMWKFTLVGEEEVLAENLGSVAFVPFTRTESNAQPQP